MLFWRLVCRFGEVDTDNLPVGLSALVRLLDFLHSGIVRSSFNILEGADGAHVDIRRHLVDARDCRLLMLLGLLCWL